jgi:predicted aminopeptidase
LIFHELTHQKLYIRDDSSFNESFAATVEQEGVRRWLEQAHDSATLARYRDEQRREQQFVALITATRAELTRIYASGMNRNKMRDAKTRAFAMLRANYQQLKHKEWQGYAGYDRWFAQDLNNAHLAALHTYREYLPAFQALLARCHGDLPAFYAAAREIGGLPKAERLRRLRELAPARSTAHQTDSQ